MDEVVVGILLDEKEHISRQMSRLEQDLMVEEETLSRYGSRVDEMKSALSLLQDKIDAIDQTLEDKK